jgi:hypothetical protein
MIQNVCLVLGECNPYARICRSVFLALLSYSELSITKSHRIHPQLAEARFLTLLAEQPYKLPIPNYDKMNETFPLLKDFFEVLPFQYY